MIRLWIIAESGKVPDMPGDEARKDRKQLEKLRRMDAKSGHKTEKKSLKRLIRREKQAAIDAIDPDTPGLPPRRSLLEEVGNAVTHGVGAVLAVIGFVLLLLRSDSDLKLLCSLIYGACLTMMFLMSCLYHSFRWGTGVKSLWRRFDYISIYLLIGGTFTPLWLLFWNSPHRVLLCCVQWALIAVGITCVAVFGPGQPKGMHPVLSVILGWCGLIFLPQMLRECLPLFLFILGGGVVYTLGVIPFALKKKGSHFLWHFFVVAGAAVQWFGIYLYLY